MIDHTSKKDREFDPTKPFKTEGGHPARIYATDGSSDYPIHGAIFVEGHWAPNSWTREGKFLNRKAAVPNLYDLVNITPRRKGKFWVNVYPDRNEETKVFVSRAFISEDSANKSAAYDRLTCVSFEVDVEDPN